MEATLFTQPEKQINIQSHLHEQLNSIQTEDVVQLKEIYTSMRTFRFFLNDLILIYRNQLFHSFATLNASVHAMSKITRISFCLLSDFALYFCFLG